MIDLERVRRIHRRARDRALGIAAIEGAPCDLGDGVIWSLEEIAAFPVREQRIRDDMKSRQLVAAVFWNATTGHGYSNYSVFPHRWPTTPCFQPFIRTGRFFTREMLEEVTPYEQAVGRNVRVEPCCRTNALGYVCPCPTPAYIPPHARREDPYLAHREPTVTAVAYTPPPERTLRQPREYWSLRNGGRRL